MAEWFSGFLRSVCDHQVCLACPTCLCEAEGRPCGSAPLPEMEVSLAACVDSGILLLKFCWWFSNVTQIVEANHPLVLLCLAQKGFWMAHGAHVPACLPPSLLEGDVCAPKARLETCSWGCPWVLGQRGGGWQKPWLASGTWGEQHWGLKFCFCSGEGSTTLLWPLFSLCFSKFLVWCQTPHPSDPRKMGSTCTRKQKAALGNVKLGCPNWNVCLRHNNRS